MKIADRIPRKENSLTKFSTENQKHLIPLDAADDHITSKDNLNTVTFTLRTVPTDAASPTYKFYIRKVEGGEEVRALIVWYTDVEKILNGLNITAYGPAVPIVEATLGGTALILFESGLESAKEAHMAMRMEAAPDAAARNTIQTAGINHANNLIFGHIRTARQFVLTKLMPRRVLARVKRQLRRDTRKPKNMKVRTYMQYILRQNMEYIQKLPPFDPNQALSSDELLDILLFGTPNSWQKEMERQGFDPITKNLDEVVTFMEQVEATEDFEPDAKPKAKNTGKKPAAKPKEPGEVLYCLFHGKGNHSTDECKKMQQEAKRLKTGDKGSYQSNNNGNNNGSKNKTWTRKDDDKKVKTELAAFVKKEIKKGIQKGVKDLAAFDKKRKADDDSSVDLNAIDLKDFNYDDMDNLKIDSDDDISC